MKSFGINCISKYIPGKQRSIEVTIDDYNLCNRLILENFPGIPGGGFPGNGKENGKMQNKFPNNDKSSVFHKFLHVMLVCMV